MKVLFCIFLFVTGYESLRCRTEDGYGKAKYCSFNVSNFTSLEIKTRHGDNIVDDFNEMYEKVPGLSSGYLNIDLICVVETYDLGKIEKVIRCVCFKNYCNEKQTLLDVMKG